MKMTIYVPDGLAAEVKDRLGTANISAICQAALQNELERAKARAQVATEEFRRIEVFDGKHGHHVAFQGREIGCADEKKLTAYLTSKGKIAVYSQEDEELLVFDDYMQFDERLWPVPLNMAVTLSLGEKYVEELDI